MSTGGDVGGCEEEKGRQPFDAWAVKTRAKALGGALGVLFP